MFYEDGLNDFAWLYIIQFIGDVEDATFCENICIANQYSQLQTPNLEPLTNFECS